MGGGDRAVCCETFRQLGIDTWGTPSFIGRLLICGAAEMNDECADDCACGPEEMSCQELLKKYSECMGKHADDLFGGGMFGIPGITP